jgi:predicted TIM-barrel fold metal-dependent hydrolase
LPRFTTTDAEGRSAPEGSIAAGGDGAKAKFGGLDFGGGVGQRKPETAKVRKEIAKTQRRKDTKKRQRGERRVNQGTKARRHPRGAERGLTGGARRLKLRAKTSAVMEKSMAKKAYERIREYVAGVPVVDCHDHAGARAAQPDVLAHLAGGYYGHDLASATSTKEMELVRDETRTIEERWPVFERAYRRSRFTGYGLAMRMATRKAYREEEITLESVRRMQERALDFSDPAVYDAFYRDARIVARIADSHAPAAAVIAGTYRTLAGQRIAISLPSYHALRSRKDIEASVGPLGREARTLDEYTAACREIFEAYKRFGAVTFKDQSAYRRSIKYLAPSRAEAEALFNRMLNDAGYVLEPERAGNPLCDYLMHEFMKMAREMDLPVQIHTGHLAGLGGDVSKANAILLVGLLRAHEGVRFDLFHGNWPYAGEMLFLAKNYPNVAMDLCWVHIIDPMYSRRIFADAVSAVAHSKIHGFGSDVGGGQPDMAWAHCEIARDNIAWALAGLVESRYLGMDEAKEVARAVLFDNPNAFFRLGLAEGEIGV